MTITPASFRTDFTEFSSTVNYLDSTIAYYINLGTLLINPCLFGGPGDNPPQNPPDNLYDILLELFTAHNLVLEQQAIAAANNNAPPGLTTGPISSKRIGPVSVNYDVNAGIDPADGQYNLTVYGVRFIYLFKLGGAPGMVENGCGGGGNFGPFPVAGGNGWNGPPLWGWGPWM